MLVGRLFCHVIYLRNQRSLLHSTFSAKATMTPRLEGQIKLKKSTMLLTPSKVRLDKPLNIKKIIITIWAVVLSLT